MMAGRFMWRGIIAVCVVEFGLGMMFVLGGPAHRVVVSVIVIPVLLSMLHDLACRHWSRAHHVYRLVADDSATLYVGSTNDFLRRLNEHTDGSGEPWRRRIHAMRIHRSAATERQARRIERRLIRCMTYAVDREWAIPLHNETWIRPASNPLQRLSTWAWTWIYVAQAFVFSNCGWTHPPHIEGTWIIAEHRPHVDGEDWADVSEPEPVGFDDEPLTATYQRDADHGQRHAFTLIALGPVRDVTRDENPLRSRGSTHGESGTGRDASREQVTGHDQHHDGQPERGATMTDELGPDEEPAPDNETPEARRKRLARNRARRYRASKAAQ